MNRMIREEVKDGAEGSAGYGDSPEDKDKVEPEAETTDDLGYAKITEEAEPNTEDKDKTEEKSGEAEPKEKESEDIESSSGYGEDSDENGKEGEEGSKDKSEGKDGDDGEGEKGELDLGDTSDFLPEEIDLIKEVTKDMDKKSAEALLDYKRKEIAKSKELAEQREADRVAKVAETRKSWVQELKDDQDFGGDNFGANVKKVDRVINDFLPNIKKKLTEGKGMLPPYIMRDLAKMSKALYGTEKLVTGEGEQPKSEVKTEDEQIDEFYG